MKTENCGATIAPPTSNLQKLQPHVGNHLLFYTCQYNLEDTA